MNVTPAPEDLNRTLSNKKFSVPLYQREYSWTIDQASDLYYDIESADINDGHYLGSLLLYKDAQKNRMEIIDGQQRLTTLFLLMHSIYLKLQNSNKTRAFEGLKNLIFDIDPLDFTSAESENIPRLTTGKRDNPFFSALITNKECTAYRDGRMKSHKNLTANKEFFDSKINNLVRFTPDGDTDFTNVNEFAEKVIKCKFVVMTADDQSDKLLLFKTLNTRGLELTDGDLVKNEICTSRDRNFADADDVVELWDKMRKILESVKVNLDTFLFHYINSRNDVTEIRYKLNEKKNIQTRLSTPPISEKLLFEGYGQLIIDKDARELVEDMIQAANVYARFEKADSSDMYLWGLKAMGINKCYPLLLNCSFKFNETQFCEIARAIEALTFRHSVLRKDPKELEKFYYETISKANNPDAFAAVKQYIYTHDNFRRDGDFIAELKKFAPKHPVVRMIFDRIIRNNQESIDWNGKSVDIEHIMPQKPKGEWVNITDDKDEYADYVSRLGNLTILQDKLNIVASNNIFTEKKKAYEKSRLSINRSLVSYETWNFDSIQARQDELSNEICRIWSAPN